MSPREKILDRIKKLQALANNVAATENEAIIANGEAQKLITKHQIEEAELNAAGQKNIEIVFSRINTENKSDILWKNRLIGFLTEINNCRFIISKEESDSENSKATIREAYRKTIYTIFGSKDNIEIIKELYILISNQINYLTKNNFKGKGKSESNSYKLGIVTAVGQKLRNAKQQVIESYLSDKKELIENNSALIYLDKEKEMVDSFTNNYFSKQGIKLKKIAPKKVNLRSEAYSNGLKDGRNVVITNRKMIT